MVLMDGAGAVTFRDLASARAAFQLGRVRFRCLVCGRVHRSDVESEGRACLRTLIDECGWRGHAGFGPPPPAYTPAFLFVDYAWRRGLAEHEFGAANAELLPDKAVLALDPTADVEAEVRAHLEEISEQARRRVARVWELWRELVRWQRELLSARPPAEIAAVAAERVRGGPKQIKNYIVRPLAPCPFAGEIPVDGILLKYRLARRLPLRCRPEMSYPAGVAYRPHEFVAVLVVWAWEGPRRLCKGLVVYREPYGRRGTCKPVAILPGESTEEAVERVLAEGG